MNVCDTSMTYPPLREGYTDRIADAISYMHEVGFPETKFWALPRET